MQNKRKQDKRKKHISFVIFTLVCVILCAATIFIARYQHTSSRRAYDQYDGKIMRCYSSIDKDSDGVDDQIDILEGALIYVNTHPRYKSKYYNSGYPDDGYGVCTDVVANALKTAGYDLMKLVSDDIKLNPSDYSCEHPDKNIDFRRVKNLHVYFKNHAINLNTDIYDIYDWQGGDIVVFSNHIGIVSDRRNKNGIPYVIHHSNPFQFFYEQDILESRNDIVGHYRISQ